MPFWAQWRSPCTGELFEDLFSQKLPGAADRRVPGQRLVQLIADKIQHVQAHADGLDNPAITEQILQIANQNELEKDHRINGLVTFSTIVRFGGVIKPL